MSIGMFIEGSRGTVTKNIFQYVANVIVLSLVFWQQGWVIFFCKIETGYSNRYVANGLDVHRGSWPKMSNNTYTRLAVPGLSGSLSFDIQKVHSGKLEELEAAEIITFEWVTDLDENLQENHLTIIPSVSGDTEEEMAAAALSRRQTTQVCALK